MRPLMPIEKIKVDGQKIRAPHAFIALTENVIAVAFRSNPNKGLPTLIQAGFEKILEENPQLIEQAIALTARKLGMPKQQVIEYLLRQSDKPEKREIVNE